MTNPRRIFRTVALATAVSYTSYTCWLIGRMFCFLYYSRTTAMRDDELVMLNELRLLHEGKYQLSYLWTTYWGQRTLVPRLLMMADERFFHFSNNPLVFVNMIAQCGTTGLLLWAEWRMLRKMPRWISIAAMAATAQLTLSSLQLETFEFGMSVPLTLAMLGALSAILLMALAIRNGNTSPPLALAAFGCAALCACCQAISVFLGPVILLVAFGLRARPRVLAALISISLAFAAIYSIGFSNPGDGMGIRGALLHPLQAVRIAGLMLGGPVTNQSRTGGAVCGVIGMLLVIPPVIRLLRSDLSRERAAFSGICGFLVFDEVGMAIGRYSPASIAALGSNTMLPSRYFTAPFFFWSVLLALLLSERRGIVAKASCAVAATMVGYLTLHTVPSQLAASLGWLEFHRALDVAGAGMIVGATDPKYLFKLIPDQPALDYYRPYLQQNRLSYFAEDRASWMGRDLKMVFGEPAQGCGGRMDSQTPAGPGKLRVEGFVTGPGVGRARKTEIVLTDAAGKIDGIGNTLATRTRGVGWDFAAYVNSAVSKAYLITPNKQACRFAQ